MHYITVTVTVTNLVGPIQIVTIGKYRSKVTLALPSNIMMIVMVLCTSIKGNEF